MSRWSILASVLICLGASDWRNNARLEARWQMSEIQQDDIKSLVSGLLSEHSPERDKARAWFLSHPDRSRPALHEIIRHGKPVRLVKEAVSLLGQIGDERDVSLLTDFLKQKDREVTWEAAQALAKHPSKIALNGLLEALDQSDPEIAGAAAVALGVRNDEIARKPLEKLLSNSDESVRYRSVFALQKLGAGTSAEVLRQHRDQEKSQAVRELIDKVLSEIPQ